MKRRLRLQSRRDFDRVIHGRRVFAGQAVVAFASPNPSGGWRVGVTVSRRVRGAVLRNRVRRVLREVARRRLLPADPDSQAADRGIGYDVVLIGRPALASLPFPVVEEEAAAVRARLAQP